MEQSYGGECGLFASAADSCTEVHGPTGGRNTCGAQACRVAAGTRARRLLGLRSIGPGALRVDWPVGLRGRMRRGGRCRAGFVEALGPFAPRKPRGSHRGPDPTTPAVSIPPSLPKTTQNGGSGAELERAGRGEAGWGRRGGGGGRSPGSSSPAGHR